MPLASNALTTISTAESYLGLTAGAQDTVLTILINAVSDGIEQYCARKFVKQVHSEKHIGHGFQRLYLNQYPIITQSTYPTVTVNDGAWTIGASNDFTVVEDMSRGDHYLLAPDGWTETVYYRQNTLCPVDKDPNMRDQNIAVENLAGYVLPQYASRTSTTTSITAGSSKVVLLSDTTCLAIGDTVTLSSTGAAGPPIVAAASESCTISAMTANVSITLTTVANAHAGTITIASTRTLPFDLEEAALALVGLKWLQRTNRGIVSEKTPGGYQVQYENAGNLGSIPSDVKTTLDSYTRKSI